MLVTLKVDLADGKRTCAKLYIEGHPRGFLSLPTDEFDALVRIMQSGCDTENEMGSGGYSFTLMPRVGEVTHDRKGIE
ncbi:hypothetical protein LCGC14_2170450 [marine sediment metagenome]|uniref:Uncharacterized protein n=1 Tax=marine sediment metagenome TaxID=412755 RepID=A0A0F9ECF4_9ZZZZ